LIRIVFHRPFAVSYRHLKDVLKQIEPAVVARHLVAPLLSPVVLAEEAVDHVLPFLLCPNDGIKQNGLLNEADFRR
jgi:hypothetical protein